MQDDLSIIVELVNKHGCDREKEAVERICAAIVEPAVTSTNRPIMQCGKCHWHMEICAAHQHKDKCRWFRARTA